MDTYVVGRFHFFILCSVWMDFWINTGSLNITIDLIKHNSVWSFYIKAYFIIMKSDNWSQPLKRFATTKLWIKWWKLDRTLFHYKKIVNLPCKNIINIKKIIEFWLILFFIKINTNFTIHCFVYKNIF